METPEKKRMTIAIDGPSGAGKSTAGKALAKRLGYVYIDTGAMYRAVALKVKDRFILKEEEAIFGQWVSSLSILFATKGEEIHILCNGKDITEAIRSPEISRLASDISKKKEVRDLLVRMQREMAREGGVVMEGRDIGTVVLPDADIKFYLDADPEKRAKRRYDELILKGDGVQFQETLEEVKQRDHQDMHRSLSPLKKAEDAIFIDSSQKSADEVLEEMIGIIIEKMKRKESLP
jgi:cytidylate kinase